MDSDLADRIKRELINETYYRDVKHTLISKSAWKIIGDITEALAHIGIGATAILAFSAGYFDHAILSYISGCVCTISLVLSRFSAYSLKESKERTRQVNAILQELGISQIADVIETSGPNTSIDSIDDGMINQGEMVV